MQKEDKDRKMAEQPASKSRYCVLYTSAVRQWGVAETMRRMLPEGKGEVFYPCVEFWWHGMETTRFKPLFPGYVFIRSELEAAKLHDYIRKYRGNIQSFVREIHIDGVRNVAGYAEREEAGRGGWEPEIIDIKEDEAEFLDFLLGMEYDDSLERRKDEAEEKGVRYLPPAEAVAVAEEEAGTRDRETAAMEAELRRRKKQIPRKGVLQISFGYEEGGHYVVMDGPLRGYEKHIVDYKRRDQKAYLDLSVAGHVTKAGLIILGKKVWFPQDKKSPELLSDGSEFQAQDLVKLMRANYFDKEKKERRIDQRRQSRET